jgi:hypothetical protein
MEPSISNEDKNAIKSMLPDKDAGIMSQDINKKYILATKGLYEALKRAKREMKCTAKETLRLFGFEFDCELERETMQAIIAHGIFVFLRNNWHQDVHCYESSCPETLEEWYYELARFCNGDSEFSPEALHILTSCCYYEITIKPVDNSFAASIDGVFAPDAAIDLFLLDDMNRHFETSIGQAVFENTD